MSKTLKKSLVSSIIMYCVPAFAQNIDINTGMSEVKGQLDSLFTGVLNIAMILCGIGAIVGLIITIYNLYTDEHGSGWKSALTWFGILAFACIALYVIKTVFV